MKVITRTSYLPINWLIVTELKVFKVIWSSVAQNCNYHGILTRFLEKIVKLFGALNSGQLNTEIAGAIQSYVKDKSSEFAFASGLLTLARKVPHKPPCEYP